MISGVVKILLVDDREDNLMSMESLLQPAGYQLVKASSGRQALKTLLTETDFALILMDVEMPNLNGFETASMIYAREKLRHIPIIFITAHNREDENIFKGYKIGAVDYIYKPVNPDLLRAKVSVFIDLYQKKGLLIEQERKLSIINTNLENEINERRNSEEKVKSLNLQLLQYIDKLEEANKDLDRVAFMASHDLQEPLRKILIFNDRLLQLNTEVLDEESLSYITRVKNTALRLQQLIKDIMTFSKISIEKSEFTYCEACALVTEALTEMDDIIKEKGATIHMEELPRLFVNPNLFRPLLYNIIGNAIKYSRKDVSPVIKIYSENSLINVPGDDFGRREKYHRIYIEDNGIGFEQKYSEQIFMMFKRLHHKHEYDGTGIGLALCKKIIEEHNGFITAKSDLNKGSTFIISLPIVKDAVPAEKSLN
ncbi:MAG: response regulator [Bacteroidota bacterium]|nr:response regulator [Bacteroidota bacterium]